MRAVLVVNTRSRKGRDLFRRARALLMARGVELAGAYAVRNPERLPEIVRDAVHAETPLVVVGGGDGTISSVVDFLPNRSTALGILPLGTANCFARTLSIPFDLEGAVDVILDGKPAQVDLGRLGDDLFANAAAIGLPSVINQSIPHGLKRRFGRLGYLLYGARALLAYRPFEARIASGGRTETLRAVELRVVNGAFLGGIQVAEEANVESEDIVVQAIVGTGRWALVDTWARQFLGRALPDGRLRTFRAPSFRIETTPPEPVSVDGEVIARTPIEVGVARQALRVMVPREREDLD